MDAEEASMPEMFFFPYLGGGHILPMLDLARLFASRGAKSTILAPPSAAPILLNSLRRDQSSGRPIALRTLHLPPDLSRSLDAADMSAAPFLDTTALRDPLRRLLADLRPDCLVADAFHPWAADLSVEAGTPLILFNGSNCFARCVELILRRHAPYEVAGSDSEPFLVPGLPDRIELTRSQLPISFRVKFGESFWDMLAKAFKRSFGMVVNSFYDVEAAYVEIFKREMVRKTWLVGPVSLYNRNTADKEERGRETVSTEAKGCISWLDSKRLDSVLFISFGSLVRLAEKQILEIAHGLEAANCHFVWAMGKVLGKEKDEDGKSLQLLPEGFEERALGSGKGLVLREWAPQLAILEHPATGGFMTHCGWNSAMEAVSAGVAVATWPLTAEQFCNEKLLTEVLKVGLRVGSVEWAAWNGERAVTVGREKVAEAVARLMGGGEEVAEMRRRARELAEKAKRAVEEGGSSHSDAVALVEVVKARRRRDVSG